MSDSGKRKPTPTVADIPGAVAPGEAGAEAIKGGGEGGGRLRALLAKKQQQGEGGGDQGGKLRKLLANRQGGQGGGGGQGGAKAEKIRELLANRQGDGEAGADPEKAKRIREFLAKRQGGGKGGGKGGAKGAKLREFLAQDDDDVTDGDDSPGAKGAKLLEFMKQRMAKSAEGGTEGPAYQALAEIADSYAALQAEVVQLREDLDTAIEELAEAPLTTGPTTDTPRSGSRKKTSSRK